MAIGSDTIFSLSSAPGRAGVAVFRLSGSGSGSTLEALTDKACPVSHKAVLRTLHHDAKLIDEGLVLWMPGPRSFTGEDCAEFQVHGSLAVIETLSQALMALGARQAEPGEFTRRAVMGGKMDLTEAEGLADLIDAQTVAQHQQALRQMQGGLKATYESWRSRMIDALAMIEGEIDFPDEDDVPDSLSKKAGPVLKDIINQLEHTLNEADRGERVRTGLKIVLIGAPNSGKSSIINTLAGEDLAIISPEAGTTRDIISQNMIISGLPVRLSDTAGLRETKDPIEVEGVRRAETLARDSDIRIGVYDVSSSENVSPNDIEIMSQLKPGDALLMNKIDKRPDYMPPDNITKDIAVFSVSAINGAGMDILQTWLAEQITERFSPQRLPGLTRVRHRDCVVRALDAARRAAANLSVAAELSGDDLRSALHAIKELAGETDIDAVFDQIFSRFCIGK